MDFNRRSEELFSLIFSNNLLASLCRYLLCTSLIIVMVSTAFTPAMGSIDWSSFEGDELRNGLQSDTVPDSMGEVSVKFNKTPKAGTTYVSPDSSVDTLVTHLSRLKYVPDSSPVQYVSPGETATFRFRAWNTGNGPDTYSIRQAASLLSGWDTSVIEDLDEDGSIDPGEPDITDRADVRDIASRDTGHVILVVNVPSSASVAQRDTFTVFSRSLRTSDPEPGEDTAHMVVQTDTSSVDVFDPNPPFDFVDTQAITNDTATKLRFQSLENVVEQNVTYVDPNGTQTITGFHSFVSSDSDWTLTNEEGDHVFKVQYKFADGQFSDTYTDQIRLDHTAPTDTKLFINNDSETTASLDVQLDTFAASDTDWVIGSSQGRVVIDNDSSFATVEVDTRPMPAGGDRSGDAWTLTTQGQVFARFIDAAGNRTGIISDTIAIELNTLVINQNLYTGLRETAKVTVNDFGANTDPSSNDDTTVVVTSDLDRDGITVQMTETSVNSGLFEGSFRFTEGFSDDTEDKIFVEPGAEVTVRYVDSSGNVNTDTAIWKRKSGTQNTLDDVRTWPNPFRPLKGEPFVFQNLPADQGMEIMIFNVSGQLVRKLTVGRGIEFNPNGNIARWFGKNDVGDRLASGTYIYVIQSQYGTKRGKLTLVK